MRLAIGNGLRSDVWREFLERFGRIEIREFYASTEGNVGFVNYAGKIGAVGRLSYLHRVRAFDRNHVTRAVLPPNAPHPRCVFLSSHRNCSLAPSFSTTRSGTSRSETPEACVSRCLKVRGHARQHETRSTPSRVPYKERHFTLQTND